VSAARIRIGTSGWSYRGWIGPLYPSGTSTSRMLHEYALAGLETVEAHNTYRRRPTASALEAWVAAVPETFRVAPKAHAAITHQRDLTGVEDRVSAFFDGLRPLGARLGPVLFSLPHRSIDMDRLERLLAALPPGARAAFELWPVWHVDEVRARLESRGATLVVVDTDDDDGSDAQAAPVGAVSYVRLRRTAYDDADLDRWAARLKRLSAGDRDVYAFVRHDDVGDAPRWALALRDRL
jgi:uncharacterized protein YecE (DUF72 family)